MQDSIVCVLVTTLKTEILTQRLGSSKEKEAWTQQDATLVGLQVTEEQLWSGTSWEKFNVRPLAFSLKV